MHIQAFSRASAKAQAHGCFAALIPPAELTGAFGAHVAIQGNADFALGIHAFSGELVTDFSQEFRGRSDGKRAFPYCAVFAFNNHPGIPAFAGRAKGRSRREPGVKSIAIRPCGNIALKSKRSVEVINGCNPEPRAGVIIVAGVVVDIAAGGIPLAGAVAVFGHDLDHLALRSAGNKGTAGPAHAPELNGYINGLAAFVAQAHFNARDHAAGSKLHQMIVFHPKGNGVAAHILKIHPAFQDDFLSLGMGRGGCAPIAATASHKRRHYARGIGFNAGIQHAFLADHHHAVRRKKSPLHVAQRNCCAGGGNLCARRALQSNRRRNPIGLLRAAHAGQKQGVPLGPAPLLLQTKIHGDARLTGLKGVLEQLQRVQTFGKLLRRRCARRLVHGSIAARGDIIGRRRLLQHAGNILKTNKNALHIGFSGFRTGFSHSYSPSYPPVHTHHGRDTDKASRLSAVSPTFVINGSLQATTPSESAIGRLARYNAFSSTPVSRQASAKAVASLGGQESVML